MKNPEEHYCLQQDSVIMNFYAIVIEGLGKSVLFDTGANPGIFESNFRKLGIDEGKIDDVAISHDQGSFRGGLHGAGCRERHYYSVAELNLTI